MRITALFMEKGAMSEFFTRETWRAGGHPSCASGANLMPGARGLRLLFSLRLNSQGSSLVDPVIGFATHSSVMEVRVDDWP